MTQHDSTARLGHMLRAAADAAEMADGASRNELDSDQKLRFALVHLLMIIGEAASRIPADDRQRFPAIPWAQVVGLRNRIVHGYFDVDLDIVWQIVEHDLPPLIAQLERILEEK